MATSTLEARQALIDLGSLTQRDIESLWSGLVGLDATEVRDALIDVLPSVFNVYGSAAAALAADWYDELREAAGVGGSFAAALADEPTPERFESLARWSVGPLFAKEPDWDAALVLLTGGMQRTVADQHRETIVRSSIADPSALGWRRIGQGHNCGFCNMLISRGDVYTQSGVMFKSHDRCNCAAAAVFEGEDVKIVTDLPLRVSQRNRSKASKKKDNKRAYDFIKDHGLG